MLSPLYRLTLLMHISKKLRYDCTCWLPYKEKYIMIVPFITIYIKKYYIKIVPLVAI